MDPEFEHRLAAILSADAVGYSRLMAQDEAATIRAVSEARDMIAGIVCRHGGRVVDAPGDNVLAEFPTALGAVRCGVEMQQALRERNSELPAERRMEFRVGVHLGDMSFEGERLYGDGVNIAARLQRLADPGGLCISAAVHDLVRTKLSHPWDDMGERELKNIPYPVRVLSLALGEAQRVDHAGPEREVFESRPAIAVLAFEYLGDDPDQEHFADGVAENLITRLSHYRGFPVIARNSTFVYKGEAVDVKRVGRQVGARYVVEGSVRKAGKRLRVTAQLIDATTGHHVWAERYDRELRDIFELQDEITEAIVGSLYPELRHVEVERAGRRDPANLGAWECLHRGMWHFDRMTKEDCATARSFYERAIELDPGFAEAYSSLSRAYQFELAHGWSESPAEAIAVSFQAAQRAVEIDPQGELPCFALGLALAWMGEPEKALVAVERAVALNPSSADAHYTLAFHLTLVGRPDESLTAMDRAERLSPRHPEQYIWHSIRAMAHIGVGQYLEAAAAAQRSVQLRPEWPLGQICLAASLGLADRREEAKNAFAAMHADALASTPRLKLLLGDGELMQRFVRGLRAAGLE